MEPGRPAGLLAGMGDRGGNPPELPERTPWSRGNPAALPERRPLRPGEEPAGGEGAAGRLRQEEGRERKKPRRKAAAGAAASPEKIIWKIRPRGDLEAEYIAYP